MQGQPVSFNRDDLARFIPDPRTIRAFENINLNQDTIIATISDIQNAPILGFQLSAVFSADRQLVGSTNIILTDGGPKTFLEIDLTDLGLAGTYGSDSETISVTVDDKGRVSGVTVFTLNTDNITEGASNLFFTQARARASVSGSATVTYNSGTGVFSLTSGNVTTALGYTPQPQSTYLTAISGTVPAPDGTYLAPTSIQIVNGIIVAIS